MPKTTKIISWLVPAVLALILLALSSGFSYQFDSFKLSGPKNRIQNIDMPFQIGGWGRGTYTLKGNLVRSWFNASTYQIIPDDYLEALYVNDKLVDLSQIPNEKRKDVYEGFVIDLKEYVVPGNNQLQFVFLDYGGNIAMEMKASKTSWHFSILLFGWLFIGVWIFLMAAYSKKVSRLHTALYFLILLGSIVKVWYVFTYNPVDHIWSDPARHWEQGTDLLRSDLMALTDPIGYQVYVAVIAKVTAKVPELVAFYASLLGLFACWIWYRFLREVQSNKTLALSAWAFFGLLPSWTLIYSYFMQETLFIPILGAAMWASWRCRRKSDVRSFGLMVFIWIIAGLTRGIAIPIAALVCTWLWLAQDQKMPKAVISSVILIFVMGPLTYRAYHFVNHFAPHGMGHLNVIYAQSGKKEIIVRSERSGGRWTHGFGSPSTGAKPFEPFSDWMTERTGKVTISVDLDEGTRDWKKALANQKMDIRDYLWITKENFIFLFFASSWPDNNAARFLDRVNIGMRFLWAPVFIVLVIWTAIYYRKLKGQWLLPSVIGVWFLLQCLIPISLNEGRYRKPFEGIAISQIVLLLAAASGQARSGAPSEPLSRYWQPALSYIRKKREQLSHTEEGPTTGDKPEPEQ